MLLLGEAVSDALGAGDESVIGGLIAAATLVLLTQGEWEQALCEADAELNEVRRAFLETDGTISILKRKNR